MQHLTHISIAEFIIRIQSNLIVQLEEGYSPFVVSNTSLVPDITINCFAGLPELNAEDELLFEAANDTQKFYSIFRHQDQLAFVIFNQQQTNSIQQIAFLNKELTQWDVYSELESGNTISPLNYPLGPIVMQYLTVKNQAVMIHASCIFDSKKGRIFTGFSGNGKSTISKIWATAGNLVINDDRIIIRKHPDGYFAYNTPMYYKDIPKKTALHAIYLISHSPVNKIKKISGALAITKVLAFCIQNNFEQRLINNQLDVLSGLSNAVSVYELGFVPDSGVIQFILDNETTSAE